MLRAQVFDLSAGRLPVTALDGLWRFHSGDNPAWSSPTFDDSQWPLLRSDQDWGRQGYRGMSGVAWYRFKVVVPAGIGPLTLSLPNIFTSYEVYANGKLIGHIGEMPPHAVAYSTSAHSLYALPPNAPGTQSITMAIRVWHWPAWVNYFGGGPETGGGLIGATSVVESYDAQRVAARHWSLSSAPTLALLQSLAGLYAIALFLLRRSEREYLWFAAALLFAAAGAFLWQTEYFRTWRVFLINPLWHVLAIDCVGLAEIAFYYYLLKARRSLLFWIALAGTLTSLLLSCAMIFGWDPPSIAGINLTRDLLGLPLYLWVLWLVLRRARQNFPDARLLLAPVVLQKSANLFQNAAIVTLNLGWQHSLGYNIVLFNWPFRIELIQAADALFLLAMLAILISRFTRTSTREERFSSELEAARGVQQFLIPENTPVTPGLAIESEYRPAREVGGDFYQVIPGPADGSTLIVVGDVAGKGMQAGMLVALLVGVIRNEAAHGRGTLANAGHLAPYLNGVELSIEGALPLGAVPGVKFPVIQFHLASGDSLTLMTDGVAEAQNSEGHLFGFDRIAELLRKGIAPSALAAAAQAFGQEDDITVLTVARLAASVAA